MIHRWVLDSGLTVLYQSNSSLPLAVGTLLLRGGSSQESPSDAGLANLTGELLLQGTHHRTARQIADRIESVGGSLGIQTTDDYVELGWLAPAQQMERMLEVLADVVIRPRFPTGEISKERAQILSSLATRYDSIFNIAHDRFNEMLYGDHAYGRLVEGSEKTVRSFNRFDFIRWHGKEFHPEKGILSVVAPFPAPAAKKLLLQRMNAWCFTRLIKGDGGGFVTGRTPESPRASLFQKGEELTKNKSAVIRAPFEQAYLMTGVQAPSSASADYVTLKVLNTIFGGGMSSRLFLELREKLSLAYEVSSFFPSRLQKSQWTLYMGLPPGKLPLARKKLAQMLDALVNRGVSSAEVRQAQEMIKGSFVMEHQTRRRQAWYAAWGEFRGRGPSFAQSFLKEVEHVTPHMIKQLARSLLAQPRVTVEVIPK